MKIEFFFRKFIIYQILFFSIIISGCRENGCTDKAALNYNIAAEDDDGSCVYCNIVRNKLSEHSIFLVDINSMSQFYLETIAEIKFTRLSDKYNSTTCGSNKCLISIDIHNIFYKEIEFTYVVIIPAPYNYNASNLVIIPPYQTVSIDTIEILGSNNNCDIPTFYANQTGFFIYH